MVNKKIILLFHPSWAIRQVIKILLPEKLIIDIFEKPDFLLEYDNVSPKLLILGIGSGRGYAKITTQISNYAEYYSIPSILIMDDVINYSITKQPHNGTKIWIAKNRLHKSLVIATQLFVSLTDA